MTTRHDLFLRVRDAIKDAVPNIDPDSLATGQLDDGYLDDMAYAAVEAVIATIGDHALAQMIGDTGERTEIVSRVREVGKQGGQSDEVEILQDDDEGDADAER